MVPLGSVLTVAVLLIILDSTLLRTSHALSDSRLPKLKAAVLVPGFLTGAQEFESLTKALTDRGIPTIAVPFPNWHWLPCLGGRSVRPMLERLDFAVRHLAAAGGDISQVPTSVSYSLPDLWTDFRQNPGGIFKVGGSDVADEYPVINPRGEFPAPAGDPKGKIALIGHSAGGWISRIYLSNRNYGGKVYDGQELVHSLVTLGTPHTDAPGPAFQGVVWCNKEEKKLPVRELAVGGTGFKGGEWGGLTKGAYSFCCNAGSDGTTYDGDGVTPIQCSLGLDGADTLVVDGVTHFCWSDVFGGDVVAPELTQDHRDGRPWYGSDSVIEQWADWLERSSLSD